MKNTSIPKTVSKGALKAKMLEYFRAIERSGKALIVTDNNQPVLKIIPLRKPGTSTTEVFKNHRGKVKYFADLNEATSEEWEDK